MISPSPTAPRIVDLAERIVADIRRKRLRPGDPYLGTAEIARLLRVSGTTANRALQLLAQRQVLERRQRRGTFIARPPDADEAGALDRVHLLVHQDYLRTEGLLADGVLLGIQGELPQAQIQFDFLPETSEVEYVRRLIDDALRAPGREGFVLVRSSVFAQRLVAASGLPAVVSGTLQPSVRGLSSVDRDHRAIGRLMATHMLALKCRRVAVLLRDRVGEGDHMLLDAVIQELTAAGLAANALVVRCLPADDQAVRAAVRALVDEGQSPLGLVCRSQPLAEAAAQEVNQSGARRGQVALCDVYRQEAAAPVFPHIVSELSPKEIGSELGRLLKRQARGEQVEPESRIVPVELCVPPGPRVTARPISRPE